MKIHTLRSRLIAAHPDHHAIAKGMAFVAVFLFLGKLAGAAKEMAVAYRYGIGAEVDAYLFVLNVVSWPAAVAFSLLSVVLVPLVARLRHERSAELPRFRAELLALTIVVGTVLAGVAWGGLTLLLNSTWSGLPPATAALAMAMVPAMSLLAPFGLLIALCSAWTLASGRHANSLVEGVPAVVIAIAVVVFIGDGAEPLIWGTLAGYLLHLASLAIPLARNREIEAPRFAYGSTEWTPFWRGFGIMLGGQVLLSSTSIIDQFFAAHMGTGAVAALGYANRILALVIGLGATAVSRATLPVFSRAHAGGMQAHRMAMQWFVLMFLLGLAAMVVAWWLTPWAVKILFERGAFGPHDTLIVADLLRSGLMQLPFFFSGLVLVSYVSSLRRYGLLFWSGVLGFAVKIVANLVLTDRYGINGIAMAWTAVYAANSLLFWLAIRRRT